MITYKDLVKILGCSVKTAYNKLYNINTFTFYDIHLLHLYYNISYDDVIIKIKTSSYHLMKEKGKKK